MGYKIICLNLYYWPNSEKFPNLTKNAEFLLKSMQSPSCDKVSKKLLKKMYLTAIGRFALNVNKESKVENTVSAQKLFLSIYKKECNAFDIFGESVLLENRAQMFNFSNHLEQCVKAKIWPYLFAFCANSTRIDAHRKAFECISNRLILNRIDTDSLFLTYPQDMSEQVKLIFPPEDYKIECDDVRIIVCSKDKCYRFATSDSLSIIAPGLKLSIFERHNCDVFYRFKFVKSRFRTVSKIQEQPFELIETVSKGCKY